MKLSFALSLAFFLLSFRASPARAQIYDQTVLLQLGAAYHYSNSLPDNDSAATYEKKFVNGFVGNVRVGTTFSPGVYLGAAAAQWVASRKLNLAGVEKSDVLNYQTLGLELGLFVQGNPRVFLMLVGGAHYPLKNEVTATTAGVSQTFQNPHEIWGWEIRGVVGVKVFPRVSLVLDFGYQWTNLRFFNAGGTPYIAGGGEFNLSAPKFGVNLGIHI